MKTVDTVPIELEHLEKIPSIANHLLIRATQIGDANKKVDDIIAVLKVQLHKPQLLELPREGNSIGIDSLRTLTPILSKVHRDKWLIVVIKDSHLLTLEAQNYLLKLLEESRVGVLFILSADNYKVLLPTIISRMHLINCRPISLSETEKPKQALYRASGYSKAKLAELATGDSLTQAKTWLRAKRGERLGLLNTLSISRTDSLDFLMTLKITLFGALLTQAKKNGREEVLALADKINAIELTEERILKRGNLKINLSQLALRI